MKNKCANVYECGDNMMRAMSKMRSISNEPMSMLPNVLTYESVKLMKRPVSMNTLMKVLRLMYT